MPSIELAVLTKAIEEKDFHTIQKAQINDSFFFTAENREIYKYLRDVYHSPASAGDVPSLELVKYRFPGFYPAPSNDTLAVLVSELRREKIRADLLTLSQDLQIKAELDPLAAMATLRAESSKIAQLAEAGSDLSIAGAFNMLIDRYEMVQRSGGVVGIPYPWGALNEETQGMQAGQFIVLYGRPKSMKSWLGLYMAAHAYLNSRRRVLFYTREMSPELVAMRTAAIIAKVDYKSFKNGTLQPELKNRVFTILRELIDDEKAAGSHGSHQPYFIITTDRSTASGGGGGGVGWLQAKIRDLQPDLVVVDGMYLMKDDRGNQRSIDWKAIAHISQDLKLTAQEFNIPLLGITQANRAAEKSKGEDLTELAFSDALGQDADAVFRVSRKLVHDANNITRCELSLTAPGLREGVFNGIIIRGEPGGNFDYLRTMLDQDAEKDDYQPKKNGATNGTNGTNGVRRFSRPPAQYMDPKLPVVYRKPDED